MPALVRWEHPNPLCIYGNPWKTLWLGKLYQYWVKTTDSWLSGVDTWSDPHRRSAKVGELEAWGNLLRTLIPGITQVSVLNHPLYAEHIIGVQAYWFPHWSPLCQPSYETSTKAGILACFPWNNSLEHPGLWVQVGASELMSGSPHCKGQDL